MIRNIFLSALVLALAFGASLAMAQEETETKSATGTVKAVATDSLTLTEGDQEWEFVVDDDTTVVAKGGSTVTKAAEMAGKKTTIKDFVQEGQRVTVEYHEKDGKLHAVKVTFPKVRPTK